MPKKKPKVKITDCLQECDPIETNIGCVQVPDPAWRFVDANGETHKWVDGHLPTLTQRSLGRCWDAEHEEYSDVFEWVVPATGEVVKPEFFPLPPRRDFTRGPASISGRFRILNGPVVPGDVFTAAEAGLPEGTGGSIRIASLDIDETGDWDAVAPGWGME